MKNEGRGRKIANVLTTVLLVILVAIVVFVFIARLTGNSPSFFGYHIFQVASGSMEPTLMTHDVILVKETDLSEIHKSDIITYKPENDFAGGMPVTHMVVEEPVEDGGIYHLQTQGINAGTGNPDDKPALDPPITGDQVEGKYIRTLPVMTLFYKFFQTRYGLIAFVFLIVALFGYEMISLILSYRSMDEHDEEYYAPKSKKKRKKRK